jgi:predicted cobalt transporter CbtA
MVRTLLLRGMLAGLIAGLLTFGFLKIFGEPPIDRAIAFESRISAESHHASGAAAEPDDELVSRPVQSGVGLLTGVLVYSAAFGGLFGLAVAAVTGRVGSLGPRGTAALLAGAGFVAIYLVPALKYPASPPSVGQADTIQFRTALYFGMILASVAGMIGAALLRGRLLRRFGGWDATLLAALAYGALMFAAGAVLPDVNEVPEHFPAVTLWQFRIASMGSQAVLWASLGLLFGLLTERHSIAARRPRLASRAV